MATRQQTIDHLLDLCAKAGSLRAQKMFGEYALYSGAKLVALVCDDMLFVKKTEGGKAIIAEAPQGSIADASPYPGAKPCWQVDADQCEDRDWLASLIAATAHDLPEPKPKKARRPS